MAHVDVEQEQYWHTYFDEIDNSFIRNAELYDNGEKSAADVWLEMKHEIDFLTSKIEERKEWGDQNRNAIADEFEKYGKEGYKGYKAVIQSRSTMSYKSIQQWADAEKTKKEIESKAKLAYQMQQNGLEPIDGSTGELLPLPEVTQTHFLKTEKVK